MEPVEGAGKAGVPHRHSGPARAPRGKIDDGQETTPMRYMLFIKHPGDYEGEQAPQALYDAMGEFIGEQARKGAFIDGAGLQPLRRATRVRLAGGRIQVTDGPFAEAKEVVGGYALCEFPSHEAAVALATEFMELHRRHWPEFEGECEVRPFEVQDA